MKIFRKFIRLGLLLIPVVYDQTLFGSALAAVPEFRVNTYTDHGQFLPGAAMNVQGSFVIVWVSDGQDGEGYGIYAQRYNPLGTPQGSELRVNTYTRSDQGWPAVAMDAGGNFVITWQSLGQDGNDYGIYARRYNRDGSAWGDEFQVTTDAIGLKANPAVAMDGPGNFVITWESSGPDEDGIGIAARLYNSDGAAQGSEFRVNTYTTGDQSYPSVAMDAQGNFMVAWMSDGSDGGDFGIAARRYSSDGTARGGEFTVNTFSTGGQLFPAAAMNSQGNFVIVWQSHGQDGSSSGIFAQRYDSNGARQGNEFRVNSYTINSQSYPSVAMDAQGNFVVAWQSLEQDGSFGGIYAQRYSGNGTLWGDEFRVNNYTNSQQRSPAVAMGTQGNFVVTWESVGQDGDFGGIYAQRYNADGLALGGEPQVNTYTAGDQYSTSAAMDAQGNFVIAWMSAGQDGSGTGIYARQFNVAGVAQRDEFRVNTTTADNQFYPSVAIDGSGRFLVSWQSALQDGSGNGIYAQRYNADGVAQGNEFPVNTTTANSQTSPSVAMNAAGNFVITWQSDGQDGFGNGIYAQRFDAAGAMQGGEFQVAYAQYSQSSPSVAMDAAGNFVITWQSNGQDGFGYGIYARRYNYDGTVQGDEFRVNGYMDNDQMSPSVAMDSLGNFVIVWQSSGQDGSGIGIFGQRYDNAGRTQGGEFRVNSYTTGDQSSPAVAMAAGGNYVITWQSSGQDGSGTGICARRYGEGGTALGDEFRINAFMDGNQGLPSVALNSRGNFVVAWQSADQDGDGQGVFMKLFQATHDIYLPLILKGN